MPINTNSTLEDSLMREEDKLTTEGKALNVEDEEGGESRAFPKDRPLYQMNRYNQRIGG